MNSRTKGKVGEREFALLLTDAGFAARRGQQFSGSAESPDVVCESLSNFHFEIKRVQRLNIYDAMAQAIGDSGGKIPVVAHRRNNGKWMVTMMVDGWLDLVRQSDLVTVSNYEQDNPTSEGQQP